MIRRSDSDRPNIRMVDRFGRGRVFVAGGKQALYFSPSFTHMEFPQMQPSMYISPFPSFAKPRPSVHSPTGGQGLNNSVQDAVSIQALHTLHA